jgi:hypothetical protein
MIRVSRVRALVLVSIVLLWVAAPAVACVLPGVTLTPAERECCHHMAQHCGQTVMPASHSCCQAPARHDALKQTSVSASNRRVTITAIPIQVTFVLPVTTRALLAIDLHSPPPPDPQFSTISILRI